MKFGIYHNVNLSDKSFLITGGAGFIGSNIVDYLVQNNAGKIRILDNLSTGKLDNIRKFIGLPNVEFIEGDIRSIDVCRSSLLNIEFVSHQAALGSIPRSIKDPITSNEVNINGFLNMLYIAKEYKVSRMVYAASSSTYGDSISLPKKEENIGNPLSPYAITKYVNELYGQIFSRIYEFHTVGLRYFNVFGPKQSANGEYSAVIPLFISSMIKSEKPKINGLGNNTRDFTFVSNVVQANIKSMLIKDLVSHEVLNIACGNEISLLDLVSSINHNLGTNINPVFREPRLGDIDHSKADISKAKKLIGYFPTVSFEEGIKETIDYFKTII